VRWALLADIHANLEALQACLEQAGREGAESYAFVGDLIGYGADPSAVIDIVEEHARRGAVVVRGNHDAAALENSAETMNPSAARAVLWTRKQLNQRQVAFLDALPLTARREGILFVHASAASPGQWTYVTDPARAADSLEMSKGATWIFSGHVHEQALYFASAGGRPVAFRPKAGIAIPVEARRRWLAIVGSVGQPRDGRTDACWALFDDARQTLTFHRVAYDWAQAAAKVRAAGLPERLAHRLEHGE
jgi:diadenosine tetraphosphatase ApaH/serine/threonine PP2A family protein phosphatase